MESAHKLVGSAGPWFRSHRWAAVVVSAALFVVVFTLRVGIEGKSDAITVLFVLPVALLALTFGFRVGVGAGLLGAALVFVWVFVHDVHLSPLGVISRVMPMLLLGVLVGAAADALEASARAERELLEARRREREAAEINDSIIQRLVAAKWLLESQETDRSLVYLTESIETAQQLVGDLLRGRPITPGMFRRQEPVGRETR